MVCNSSRSTGRTSTANQTSSDVKNDTNSNTDFQMALKKIENPSQADTITLENRETGGVLIDNIHTGRGRGAGVEVGVGVGVVTGMGSSTLDKYHSSSSSSASLTAQTKLACRLASNCKSFADDIHSLRIPPCIASHCSRDPKLTSILQDETIQPPVTTATLQELDPVSIQNNLNLRIDICHDPELFFQPVSGRKGDAKRTEARKYWSALTVEFRVYFHNAQPECSDCQEIKSWCDIAFPPRLPALFDNLREIVQMLVPDSDHDEVANHLDTELLMQQVQVGAMDAVELSNWLAKLITSHCAPMRDRSAAAVTEQIRIGTERADMEMFVDGLEKLFALLEAMKLDIANHQIRSFRYPLIEGAVEFQHTFFSDAVASQQMDITDSQQWFRGACFEHVFECERETHGEAGQRFESFIHGLVHLCSPYEKDVPTVLQYDHHRITRLQEDLQDHVQLSLCLAVFDGRAREIAGFRSNPSAMHEELKLRIICLTEDDNGNGGAISDHLDAIGMEITRAAFSLRSPDCKSTLRMSRFDFDRTLKSLHDVFRFEDQQRPMTKKFLKSLELRTMEHIVVFRKMTTLEISNTQKHWAQARSGKESLLAEWDEIARKLAHIGIVHWRVWEKICYLNHTAGSGPIELDSVAVMDDCIESLDGTPASGHSSPPSLGYSDQDSGQDMAFEQEPLKMQISDVSIQRHDSGFAEDLGCFSEHESDIEDRCRIRSGETGSDRTE